jgi:hypothetical protein
MGTTLRREWRRAGPIDSPSRLSRVAQRKLKEKLDIEYGNVENNRVATVFGIRIIRSDALSLTK